MAYLFVICNEVMTTRYNIKSPFTKLTNNVMRSIKKNIDIENKLIVN